MAETDWELLTKLISELPDIPEDTRTTLGESTLAWRKSVVEVLMILQRNIHVDLMNIHRRIDDLHP